jgi:glycoprotein-N-acetylgalactosamine 3-beta-galactosyltransferase
LKLFLKDKNSTEPITYGHDFHHHNVSKGYQSGGAGYVLSQEAMRRIHDALIADFSFCKTAIINGIMSEDIDVSRCLRRLNVFPSKRIANEKKVV